MNRILPLALLFMVLAACSSLRPVVERSRFFVLTPVGVAREEANKAVGFGQVDVPEYLQKRQIAERTGPNEITYRNNLLWAEPFPKMLQRTLAANLPARVKFSSWRKSDVRAEIYVSITRFEPDQNGSITLEADWQIRDPSSGGLLVGKTSRYETKSPELPFDPGAVVAQMSELLGKLSAEIASRL